jgi:hypothetical protein
MQRASRRRSTVPVDSRPPATDKPISAGRGYGEAAAYPSPKPELCEGVAECGTRAPAGVGGWRSGWESA